MPASFARELRQSSTLWGRVGGRGRRRRDSEDNFNIHINVSSLREVKLALFRSKKFSLVSPPSYFSIKEFRQRHSEIRDLCFL